MAQRAKMNAKYEELGLPSPSGLYRPMFGGGDTQKVVSERK